MRAKVSKVSKVSTSKRIKPFPGVVGEESSLYGFPTGLARALSLLLPGIGSMVSWHMYARIRVKVGYKLGLGYDVLGTTPA